MSQIDLFGNVVKEDELNELNSGEEPSCLTCRMRGKSQYCVILERWLTPEDKACERYIKDTSPPNVYICEKIYEKISSTKYK